MQNDMRDRLVSLINQDNCPSPYMCDEKCKYSHLEHCIGDRLADRILADGWIRPPCNVDDVVYLIGLDKKIEKHIVEGVCLYPNGWFIDVLYNGQRFSISVDKVSFTKDQAEQKLKELRENAE